LPKVWEIEKLDILLAKVQSGDRSALSRAITLVESSLPSDTKAAEHLIARSLEQPNSSHRIAITGVPGVGKSTFIDALGLHYTSLNKRVAVLAVDPSSSRTSGSILGDKTRMEGLSSDQKAFIRPSASALTLGGVARMTRETIALCEAAGFDIIIIETVGVGQSEIAVRAMVDSFVLLMLAGAGDELQGIKRGIMEMADVLLINKVEEANMAQARSASSDYSTALHMLGNHVNGWSPTVGMISALEGFQLEAAYALIEEHLAFLKKTGDYQSQRKEQEMDWFEEALRQGLIAQFLSDDSRRDAIDKLRDKVRSGDMSPMEAVKKSLDL